MNFLGWPRQTLGCYNVWIIIGSMTLITFSEMFAMPFMSTYAMNRAPKESIGQYSALYSMSWSLALIIAPILGTNVIAYFGFNQLWVLLSILAFFLDVLLTNKIFDP